VAVWSDVGRVAKDETRSPGRRHYLVEQMAQFNRERVPERRPHADQLATQRDLDNETGDGLREYFNEAELIEVCMLVGNYAMTAGVLKALRVQLEDGYPAPLSSGVVPQVAASAPCFTFPGSGILLVEPPVPRIQGETQL
jgi:hypothetical protein